MLDPSDPVASVHAVTVLRDLPGVGHRAAESIIDRHTVDFERKDGLRRLVLVRAWEVDPHAVRAA